MPPRRHSPVAAFTLIELLATIAIAAVLTVSAMVFIGNYVTWARNTSNQRTLATLNDALTRYKTEGGTLSNLSPAYTAGFILRHLASTVSWAGTTHQFLNRGAIDGLTPSSLYSSGTGKSFRYIGYGGTTLEATNPTPTSANSLVSTLAIPVTAGSICFDSNGFLWAAGGSLYKINLATGTKVSYGGEAANLRGLTYCPDGYIYGGTVNSNYIVRVNPTTGSASIWAGSATAGDSDGLGTAAGFRRPQSVTSDGAGNLYITEGSMAPGRIRKINTSGLVSTLRPTDGTPHAMFFGAAYVAANNSLLLGDCNHCHLYKFDLGSLVLTDTGIYTCGANAITADPTRDRFYLTGWGGSANTRVYYTNAAASSLTLLAGTTANATLDGAATTATLQNVNSIAVSASGTLYVLQSSGTPCIRIVTPQ